MATPKFIPTSQKRFLRDYVQLINLGKKESLLMSDLCVFFKLSDDIVCCVDQSNKKIYTLLKNKNGLFTKTQILQFKAKNKSLRSKARSIRIINGLGLEP